MSLIQYLTKIQFGPGVLEESLAGELAALGAKRVLIVTDRGVAAAGLLDRLRAAAPTAQAAPVFDETPENPTEAAVVAAADAFKAHGADAMIALGGGSPIDLAKAALLRASHDGPLGDFAAIHGGAAKIKPLPPLIAIPTTAGTGSEVGRGAIITLEGGRKLGFLSPHFLPAAAIVDPTLTLGLPPHLTAGTGMDALTHCVETYLSKAVNPVADAIAIDGLRRCAGAIEKATADGGDLAARTEMVAAAMMGAMAFQKGLGAVHAISHAMGGLPGYRLHHGMLNAALLPAALRFNQPEVGDRYPALLQAMGLSGGADLPGEIAALTARLGLPTGLSQMGVDRAAIDKTAPLAKLDHTDATNPRPAQEADYLRMMEESL